MTIPAMFWGLGAGGDAESFRGGLPMSPEDVHIRVIRLGHAIQAGFPLFWVDLRRNRAEESGIH